MLKTDKKKFYLSHIPPILVSTPCEVMVKLNRSDCVKHLRLITGEIADPVYLDKIKRRDAAKCEFCSEENCNLAHLIWEGPQFVVSRYSLFHKLNINSSTENTGSHFYPNDFVTIKAILDFTNDVGLTF